MRIGICGAGVGGLATAYGLMSLGYEVDIFEEPPNSEPRSWFQFMA